MTTDVCVIGAGPAGLAVARALREKRIPYTHLERHTDAGGAWDIDNPGGPMYESAHFISSKTMSGFSGHPMPSDYPDYPGHALVLEYLRDFADAYGLTRRIEFGVTVTGVTRAGDGWLVTRADGTSSTHSSVIVCTGSQWHPNIPELPGDFAGEVMHSAAFRSAEQFRDKRVLIVGGGNSACDIACDAARTAASARISMRRGYWFIPKHIFGVPSDVIGAGGARVPKRIEQLVFQPVLRVLLGDPRRLGLQRPDHRLFETHPVVNSQLMHHLQHGDVTARPGIADTSGTTVTYTDGSRDEIDLILMATGYRHRVPIAQEYFGDEQHPDLYLNCFSREHPGLFGVGFVETNSGAYRIFDAQAHLIAAYLDDRRSRRPSARDFATRIRTDRPRLDGGLRFDSSPRHTGYVDSDAIAAYLRRTAKRYGWSLESPPAGRAMPGRVTRAHAEVS